MIAWLLSVLASLGAPAVLAPAIAIAATEAPIGSATSTAALLVAVAFYEGGLDGRDRRTDGGETCGGWQIRAGRSWCDAHAGDHLAHAREARERLRASLARCWASPAEDRLAAYASGSCERGRVLARGRYRMARHLERTKHERPATP